MRQYLLLNAESPIDSKASLVFACSNDEPLERSTVGKRRFKLLIKRAKLLEEFTLYTLLRTFATLTTAAGASRADRSASMGHADADFTDEVYVTDVAEYEKGRRRCARKPAFRNLAHFPHTRRPKG